jgi:ankyrin repeat protein
VLIAQHQSQPGLTPLHQAALANSVECAKLLVEHGARITSEDKDGDHPIHTAARLGSGDFAAYLLEKGADVNSKNFKGIYALFWLVTAERSDLTIASIFRRRIAAAFGGDQ